MSKNILKLAIKDAGGPRVVGATCNVSYQAVQKWTANGLPRTDFTGETAYAVQICELADASKYSPEELREASLALRKHQAA